MTPLDPEASRRLLLADPWSQTLGIELGEVAASRLQVRMSLTEEHLNFLDGAHGGALFSLVEAGVAVAAAQDGADPVIIDTHLSFTAGGSRGDVFTATVERATGGRTLGTYRVGVTRGDDRTVGLATTTVRYGP